MRIKKIQSPEELENFIREESQRRDKVAIILTIIILAIVLIVLFSVGFFDNIGLTLSK